MGHPYVSPEEYLAYTTEETEKIKMMQYAKKYGSIQKGIAVLAEEIRNAASGLPLNPPPIEGDLRH